MTQAKNKVTSRNEAFAERAVTRIWEEVPSDDNPYITSNARCHGYDLLELTQKRSFTDVLYLLFRGELPNKAEEELLEQLMIALINPGPRSPGVRAAMNAGVGKTDPAHILPIGLSIHSGEHGGASEIEPSMQFLRKHKNKDPLEVALNLIESSAPPPPKGDWRIAPGFGSYFNGINILAMKIAEHLTTLNGNGETLQWGNEFSKILNGYNMGWLTTGIAAAVFTDLGFHPRVGAGLFQIISAPGILAHGIELANKPRTALPYISDENYVIEK